MLSSRAVALRRPSLCSSAIRIVSRSVSSRVRGEEPVTVSADTRVSLSIVSVWLKMSWAGVYLTSDCGVLTRVSVGPQGKVECGRMPARKSLRAARSSSISPRMLNIILNSSSRSVAYECIPESVVAVRSIVAGLSLRMQADIPLSRRLKLSLRHRTGLSVRLRF